MKNLSSLLLLTLITGVSFGQIIKLDSLSGKYQSQGIIKMDTLKKDFLYSKTKEWIALNYKSANDVIQLADKENYKIIAKGNFKTSMFMKEGWIAHTLVLDFKDGKIRYSYSDFSYYSPGSGTLSFEGSLMAKKKILRETEQHIESSVEGIKEYILQNATMTDDW
jgi:hypothetical protein